MTTTKTTATSAAPRWTMHFPERAAAPVLAPRVPEHSFAVARWIARYNAAAITHERAVALIADALIECEGLDEATALATAERYIAVNPQL